MSTPDPAFRFDSNIVRNPRDDFGTWTPQGWKTHPIKFAATTSRATSLRGDGRTITFSGLPLDDKPFVHDPSDPTGDHGIYPAEPRVEYPPGRPRWAVSHTFLAYPVADQTLYQHEYTWSAGSLTTRFRNHIRLEEAVTDSTDGRTVRVQHTPVSSVVAGNQSYPLCNSAVRGVWTNPAKQGPNYYARPQTRLCHSHNAVYIVVEASPVIQCRGIWKARPGDEAAFDESGLCIRPELLLQSGLPLDVPKLGSVGYSLRKAFSNFYAAEVQLMEDSLVQINESMLDHLRACRDIAFAENAVGFAAHGRWDHDRDIWGVPGSYAAHWDFNDNGVVDEEDEAALIANLGRQVRPNYYSAAYFGNDWLSTGVLLNPEMKGGEPVICSWLQGAGYDIDSGVINLFDTPGPNQPVFVEYHHDAPAEPGKGNILLTTRYA